MVNKEFVRVSFSCNNKNFDFESTLKNQKGYTFLNYQIIKNNTNINNHNVEQKLHMH